MRKRAQRFKFHKIRDKLIKISLQPVNNENIFLFLYKQHKKENENYKEEFQKQVAFIHKS